MMMLSFDVAILTAWLYLIQERQETFSGDVEQTEAHKTVVLELEDFTLEQCHTKGKAHFTATVAC